MKVVLVLIQKKFIVSGTFNEYTQLHKWRRHALSQQAVPKQVYIIPSLKCNYHCPSCFTYAGDWGRQKNHTLTTKIFDKQLDFVLRHGHVTEAKDELWFTFYGGEPLLNKKLIWYAARKIRALERKGVFSTPNVQLALLTNGSLIDAETARLMKKYDLLVGVSLDGSEKINNLQRIFKSGKGTFKATAKGIDQLRKTGVQWGVTMTIGPSTIDYLPNDLISLHDRFDIPKLLFNFMVGRKTADSPFRSLSEMQFKKKSHAIYDVLLELGLKEMRVQNYKRFIDKDVMPPYWFYCQAQGSGQLVLNANGTIGMCGMNLVGNDPEFRLPDQLGDIHDDPLFMGWVNRTTLMKKQCYLNCNYFSFCPGGCATRIAEITGNRHAIAKEICMVEKFLIERAIVEVCEDEWKSKLTII